MDKTEIIARKKEEVIERHFSLPEVLGWFSITQNNPMWEEQSDYCSAFISGGISQTIGLQTIGSAERGLFCLFFFSRLENVSRI